MRWLKRLSWLLLPVLALAALVAGALHYFASQERVFEPRVVAYDLKAGSPLRVVARELAALGVVRSALMFEILARQRGAAPQLKAGNYEFESPLTPLVLLGKLTRGDAAQAAIRFIDGWTFGQVRQALNEQEALQHDTRELSDDAIARKLGIADGRIEGWIFPETYHFVRGASDLTVLRRAYRLMQTHLNKQWNQRRADLPLASPYEALILASIVEKETGKAADRVMVSSVFNNRLRIGMRLQTDPTVIYGLGEAFDGNLRRRDLQADTAWNTYTRTGLPPTPIAMPGLASLQAALNPAPSKMLYFVARGDGTSHFSQTLDEHNAAVTKYQRTAQNPGRK